MKKILGEIIKNFSLVNEYSKIEKINTGFTNTLYLIDDKYILKICENKNNEEIFKREIEFYKRNKNNAYIPKLYVYHISEGEDYSYIIMECIKGKTLYNVWYKLSNDERKEVIENIVKLMKSFHKVRGKKYDWASFIINKLRYNFDICNDNGLFSTVKTEQIDYVLSNIYMYLQTDDFRLVHSDIHFDNIIMTEDNNLKIIDFETSIYAPIDYELDIFLRMCNNPLKYASEDEEKYVKKEDFEIIEPYFKILYPEIFDVSYFEIRMLIYDMEANLRLLARFQNDTELKEMVLKDVNNLKEMI